MKIMAKISHLFDWQLFPQLTVVSQLSKELDT